jgi:hypothetical protein
MGEVKEILPAESLVLLKSLKRWQYFVKVHRNLRAALQLGNSPTI